MKENKLGRKFANTWSPPPRIRSKGNHRFFTRMANKGVRKYAKLMIKAGEEASEGMSKSETLKKFKQDLIAIIGSDNKMLATYLATYITEEYEEAEQEDIEPLSETIFQALEAYDWKGEDIKVPAG